MGDRPIDRKPLIALLLAGFISQSGNQMLNLAIPWFVLQTTGSVTKTGLAAFFALLPTVIAGLLGGPLIDHLGFKRTSVLADLASGVSVALIPLIHFTIGLEFWQLLALVFFGALLDAPGTTARYSMAPLVAAKAGVSVDRAASLEDAVNRAASLTGPPIAGVLIALFGAANVLWVDAATFAVSIASVGLMVPSEHSAMSVKEPLSYGRSLKEGFSFLRKDRLLLIVIGTVTITNLLDGMFSFVILPALFNRIYESSVGLGLTFGSFGAGALLGALIYGWRGGRFSRRWTFCLAFLLVSVRGFFFALTPPVGLLMLAMFVTGLAGGSLNPILAAVEYERTPVEMRGRVLGLIQALAWAAMPLGVLLGGLLVESTSIRDALVISAAVYVSVALSLTVNRGVRDLDRVPVAPPD